MKKRIIVTYISFNFQRKINLNNGVVVFLVLFWWLCVILSYALLS